MCVCVFYSWNLYLHMASINLILMMDSINIYFSAFLIYDLDLCYFCRFQVKKKRFFENFMTIILFGAVGTLISCGIISLGTSSNIIFLFFNNINFFLLVVQRQEKVYVKFAKLHPFSVQQHSHVMAMVLSPNKLFDMYYYVILCYCFWITYLWQ